MRLQAKVLRVHRFLVRHAKKPSWGFMFLPDARQSGKVDHPIGRVFNSIFLGLLTNQATLRDVENMVESLGFWAQQLVDEEVSDTTMDTELRRMVDEPVREMVVQQVKEMHRGKCFKPVGLPCGIATIDGKNLATLDHDGNGKAQRREHEETGKEYWLAMALRATLTSAQSKPCLDQQPHHVGSNDMGSCQAFVARLHETYGHSDMFSVLDFDAGFTSLANADYVNSLGYGYIFGLKDNQPELQKEAQRILSSLVNGESAEAQTRWENRNGKKMRRSLWRSPDLAGYPTSPGDWKHLRQVWLVRQETMNKDETIEIEDRYFITSLLWNYLKPEQILLVVRNHWGIENDTFNSLDLQWQEDNRRWCTQGNAIWVLGLLRMMAYNLVQYLRKRHLRLKDEKGNWRAPPSWRITFSAVNNALVKDFASANAGVTSDKTV